VEDIKMFNNWKIRQLNKRASAEKFKPEQVIASLCIKPGDIIADIGSGGGYYTFEFAKRVGEIGKVYAVDTEQKFLDYIKSEIKKQGITNIETVLIKNDEIGLLENSVDLMFIRNVYHHLPEPIKYFARTKKYLKPHGRIALIEWNKPHAHLFLRGKHFTPEAEIVNTMTRCGYLISKKFDFLPEQSFIIFRKE
jgi:ubiquinone/menaquinone biosynthesis C-methylase UbiE